MAAYNIHAGHSLICRGASALLDEVVENRKVTSKVIEYLRAMGHTVYDCTDDVGKTQDENRSNIVKKCNAHAVDLDASIHLNSGRNDPTGDNSTGGTEAYGYDSGAENIGSDICAEIASALGIRNRGFKTNSGYYVLRNTKAKAVLVECCFVDDKDDFNHWDPDKCARAIVNGMTGQNPSAGTPTPAPPESNTVQRTYAHKVGEHVTFSTCYRSSTDPISKAIPATSMSRNHGTITKIVDAHNPYLLDNGLCWVNDGDIRGPYTATAAPTVSYYPTYTGTSVSIAAALNSMGLDGSFANREKIAVRNGISGYRGTAEQNGKLLTLLKQGKLVR